MTEPDATVTCASCRAEAPARRGLFGRRKLPDRCAACGAAFTGEVSFLGQALTDGESSGTPTADPAPPVAPRSAARGGATELQTQVVLTDPGKRKIAVIKAVRSATSLGLADAKRLVDETPSVLGTFSQSTAAALVREITDAGGRCTTKGAPPPAGPAAAGAGANAAGLVEVTLTERGEQLIAVVKVVREITGAGLAEAKRLVDGAPSVLGAFDPEAAVRAAERIEAAGGKYSLRVRA